MGQGFWVFDLVHHSIFWKTKEHNVPETGSLSILRSGVGDVYSVGFIRKS
jgi:hypothetical protein